MTDVQKKLAIAVIAAIILTFIYPPHAFFADGNTARMMGYSLINNLPRGHSVHILLLVVEWIGIAAIGALLNLILKKKT